MRIGFYHKDQPRNLHGNGKSHRSPRRKGRHILPIDAKIISVDDHVIEHPRVWLDRLPAKYSGVAPRIVKLPDGNDTWLYEGAKSGNFALNAVAGKHPREFGMDPRSYDDILPGWHDIADRIKWPHTRKMLADALANIPDDEVPANSAAYCKERAAAVMAPPSMLIVVGSMPTAGQSSVSVNGCAGGNGHDQKLSSAT